MQYAAVIAYTAVPKDTLAMLLTERAHEVQPLFLCWRNHNQRLLLLLLASIVQTEAPALTAIPVARLLVVDTDAVHNLVQRAAVMEYTAVPTGILAMSLTERALWAQPSSRC